MAVSSGCSGISPTLRRDFQALRSSQQIVGKAYIRDLQHSNDRLLAARLRSKLLKDATPKALDKALAQDAELRSIYRATYARIRDALLAMDRYATGISVVLAKLERRQEAADELGTKARALALEAIKNAISGGAK